MNANTLSLFSNAYVSGNPFALPASFTTTSATETQFLLANGQPAILGIPVGNEKQGSFTPRNPFANAALLGSRRPTGRWTGELNPIFTSESFNNRPFKLRAVGQITGGGTTLTSVAAVLKAYVGSSTTVTSGTAFASSVATGSSNTNVGAITANWMLEAELLWDSVSQTVNGTYSWAIGNTYATSTTGVPVKAITAITSLTSVTNLVFGLTWTFATTSTSNAISLVQLETEQL